MEITLLAWSGSLRPAYVAAKRCKSARSTKDLWRESFAISEKEMANFLDEKCIRFGHWSILEHVIFTFGIDKVPKSFTHQLITHRHISKAQRSDRHVRIERFVEPIEIWKTPEAHEIFLRANRQDRENYEALLKLGIKREKARSVMAVSSETAVVLTLNGRALVEMSRKRLCNRAEDTFREVVEWMRYRVEGECPYVASLCGAPCNFGACPEGEEGCHANVGG